MIKTTRSIVLFVIFAAVAFSLPAAGKNQGKTTSLELWHYFESDAEREGLQRVADEFAAANPGTTVNITHVPRDELIKQYMMGAVSGELPDIAMMDNPDMRAYIEMGLCADITDKFNAWSEKGYYYEGPLNSCKKDGRIYGLPHNSNCLELLYDVDQMREAGVSPPATWDELTAACRVLKAKYPSLYPLAFSANNNEEGTFQFMPFLISAGGGVDNLGSPEAIRAVSYWKQLVDAGYVPRDVINWGQTEVNAQFVSGNVIMQVNGPWNYAILKANAPNKNWRVTLLPKDKKYASVLGGENFAVTRACKDLEIGWSFLSTLCSGKNTAEYCAVVGKFPPRSDGDKYSNVWTSDPV
ncbi:MAG: sugar ABC transporter substrate-binding protein, partial [Treponema sp.]|nr:sugar ABC transporter substrate-binding protein [Treponema sp.]